MNFTVFKALFLDALAQVLDNRVFRILCILVALPILFTFIVGFREDELVLLFGYRRYFYDELQGFLGGVFLGGQEAQIANIQRIQTFFVDMLAGKVGIFVCIAATAFFVPRMTEKGAADTLFSKPVSRLMLYLSRYLAGLLFVGILAFVLVFGMHLGLMINSGYSDPGFLWGALTITYLFGLVHAVTMLIGVFTRSSAAAILLAMMFYLLNGCVHTAWGVKEFVVANQEEISQALEESNPSEAHEEQSSDGPPDWFLWVVDNGLDLLHYPLPKTNDAALITAELRRVITTRAPDYTDPVTLFRIAQLPDGFRIVEQAGEDAQPDAEGVTQLLRATDERGNSITLARQAREDLEEEVDEASSEEGGDSSVRRSRGRAKTLRQHVIALEQQLEDDPEVRDLESVRSGIAGRGASFLRWARAGPDGDRHLERGLVQISPRREPVSWFVWIEVELDDESAPPTGHSLTMQQLLDRVTIPDRREEDDPFAFYPSRFGWDAPLKFNAVFSIASSLAFTVVMLLLGWWKLSRIDF